MELYRRKWFKILLVVLILLAAAVLLLPRVKIIDQRYESALCSPDSFAESEPVTVQFSGFYLDFLLFQDRFYGTIHLMDYPREGKNTGGKFEPLKLRTINSDVSSGTLFYMENIQHGFDCLGAIFWDYRNERFLITSEDYNILYPAGTAAELEALDWELTQPE